jgi:cell division septum initiation protein DivIVA
MAEAPTAIPQADESSRLSLIELERDWTVRRLETFRQLDKSTQQTLGQVFETAQEVLRAIGDMRIEMEQDARRLLHSLHGERDRLADEIRDLRSRREELVAEAAASRRRAEEEIVQLKRAADENARQTREAAEREGERIRQAAEAERAAILQDAERRRADLVDEIHDLEDQIAEVSSQLHALVGRNAPSQATRPRDKTERDSAPPAPATRATRTEPEQRPTPSPSSRPTPTPMPAASPAAAAAMAPVTPIAAALSAEQRIAARGTTAVATRPTETTGPIVLTVRDVPTLAWALEFQRSLQNAAGVERVEALQFEEGTLVLSVDRGANADPDDVMRGLPTGDLRLISQEGSRFELSATG